MRSRALLGLLISISLILSPIPILNREAHAQVEVVAAAPLLEASSAAVPAIGVAVVAALIVEYAACSGNPDRARRTIVGRFIETSKGAAQNAQIMAMMVQADYRARQALATIQSNTIEVSCPAVQPTLSQVLLTTHLTMLFAQYGVFESLQNREAFVAKGEALAANPLFVASLREIVRKGAPNVGAPTSSGFMKYQRLIRNCFLDLGSIWQLATGGLLAASSVVLVLATAFSVLADMSAGKSHQKGNETGYYVLTPTLLFLSAPYFLSIRQAFQRCEALGPESLDFENSISTFGTIVFDTVVFAMGATAWNLHKHCAAVLKTLDKKKL